MANIDQTGSVDLLKTNLDDVLVPLGFAPCQNDVTDGAGQMLWCAAADEFAARFPSLPASEEPSGGWDFMCTDVSVRVGDGWRVIRVDVEGYDLSKLFTVLGLTAGAGRAVALIGSPVTDCVVELPALLRDLLDESSS